MIQLPLTIWNFADRRASIARQSLEKTDAIQRGRRYLWRKFHRRSQKGPGSFRQQVRKQAIFSRCPSVPPQTLIRQIRTYQCWINRGPIAQRIANFCIASRWKKYVNKMPFFCRIAGHPLAQNERCLHMFLQELVIDKNYVPGKIRNT